MVQINIEILKFSLNESKSIFNTKFMLIVKLDNGVRVNLYLGSIFRWLISIFSRTQPKVGTNQALKGEIYGRPSIGLHSVNSLQGWAKCGRMRPADSFGAARRQQQKRFNVRPFKKSWDTRIFQISFIWLWVLTPANSCSPRWMLLRINCESTYSRPLDVSATNKYQQLLSAFQQHSSVRTTVCRSMYS